MSMKLRKALLFALALMLSLSFVSLAGGNAHAAGKGPKAPSKVHFYKDTKVEYYEGESSKMPVVSVKVSKVKGAKGYQLKYRTREYYADFLHEGKWDAQKWSKWKKKTVENRTAKALIGLGSASGQCKVEVKVRSYKLSKKGKKIYGAWKTYKAKRYKTGYSL